MKNRCKGSVNEWRRGMVGWWAGVTEDHWSGSGLKRRQESFWASGSICGCAS